MSTVDDFVRAKPIPQSRRREKSESFTEAKELETYLLFASNNSLALSAREQEHLINLMDLHDSVSKHCQSQSTQDPLILLPHTSSPMSPPGGISMVTN